MLHEHGDDAKILAGGHSLVPSMKLRLLEPRYLIDLSRLTDMRGISVEGDHIAIGALTLHADIAASPLLLEQLPALAECAARVGDVQVRNRGTIGGSVAHADPNADEPVALLALGASFVLTGPTGSRAVPAGDFFVDLFTTSLAADEIVTEIHIPAPQRGSAYTKMAHPASGYLVVSACAVLTLDASGVCQSATIGMGGVSGKPVLAEATAAALQGQKLTPELIAAAANRAAEGTDPEGDLYAGADYKLHVATVYARQAIEQAAERARR